MKKTIEKKIISVNKIIITYTRYDDKSADINADFSGLTWFEVIGLLDHVLTSVKNDLRKQDK